MQDLITILRVVDKAGEGLYGYQSTLPSMWSLATKDAHDDNQPYPCDDDLIDFPHSWLFGFKDENQLCKWIYKPEWREAMHRLGGKVLMILIPVEFVLEGDNQVVFDPSEVVEVIELSIIDV